MIASIPEAASPKLEKLLRKPEVADLLGCSQRAVSEYVRKGELRAIKFSRAIRFDPADVAAFIDARRTTTR